MASPPTSESLAKGDSLEPEPNKTEELEQAIRETLSGSGDRAFAIVKDHFVEEELNRRTDLLVKAFVELRRLAKELKRVKPDHVLYNADKEPILEGFTKQRTEEVQKLKEQREKLSKATNKALNDLDFDALQKALGGGK